MYRDKQDLHNLNLHITDITYSEKVDGGGCTETIDFKDGDKVVYRIRYRLHCCFEDYEEGLVNESNE